MFSKTNLISTLVTTLWGFFGGYLLWGLIGDPLMEDHALSAGLMKDPPDFIHLILGCLIVGLIFSAIYSKWARGAHNPSHGMQFGILIGLYSGLGSGLIDFSTANIMDLTGTFINAVIYVVHFAIMGVLASMVYKKFSPSES
jgi:hypothetical protein